MNTTVAIVDDHLLLAQALAELIGRFTDYTVLFVAEDGLDLITHLNQGKRPDVVLLDVSMPGMDGYETAKYLKDNHPDIRAIALSMFDDEKVILRMVQNGARGYLLKGCRPDELRQALHDVRTRGFYHSERLTEALISNLNPPEQRPVPARIRLNDRELEFLKLACTDLTYGGIADKMCVSPRTVDGYRESVFEKLGVKSRVSMALEAVRQGLIKV
jgi:two-component system, NarL family, invasion response regulator UvrY